MLRKRHALGTLVLRLVPTDRFLIGLDVVQPLWHTVQAMPRECPCWVRQLLCLASYVTVTSDSPEIEIIRVRIAEQFGLLVLPDDAGNQVGELDTHRVAGVDEAWGVRDIDHGQPALSVHR